jgi:SAM-dependent methyltransferase
MNESYEKYFAYLQQRSRLGYLYRNYWLYPKLCSFLGGKVLDIGCGIGDLLRYRQNTVGVDVNPKTVRYCQQQGFDVQVMEVDKLPFDSLSFDSVIMDNVLEHIEKPELILREVRRVLVDGGTFVVGVPGSKGYNIDPDHKVFYSREKLIETMRVIGFSEKKVFSMPLNLVWLDDKINQYCVYAQFKKDSD